MTVLSEIFVKNPSTLDKETTDFLLSIENCNIWQRKYQSGSWNSIKFKTFSDVKNRLSSTANAAILRFSAKKVFIKAFQACLKNPDLACNACINLTKLVWAICFLPPQVFITPPINTLNLSDKLSSKNFTSFFIREKYKSCVEDKWVKSVNNVSITKTLCQIIIIGISTLFSHIFGIGIYMLILMLTAFFSFHRLR